MILRNETHDKRKLVSTFNLTLGDTRHLLFVVRDINIMRLLVQSDFSGVEFYSALMVACLSMAHEGQNPLFCFSFLPFFRNCCLLSLDIIINEGFYHLKHLQPCESFR